ncbi:hypothetical protein GWK47_050326 [Chionoecetes opilio]|uniref:Uncharacterized protein n=1 Tax=Chionoecetes opilio TaxID=41210 RepID=A0A8J4Y2S0_CHIOP|nr:hypothetical protein GWK47_050326 [Chionoecetes opilio]
MADILSDLKEGGDDGTPNTVVPVREEPSGLQCAPSGVCGQDPHLNKEATLHATEVQQGECESNTIHPVQARDAKPSEEAVDEPGRLAVTDGSEAAEAFKKQDDEIGLGFDKSEVAKANVSQAKDPPEGEHDQAEGKKLMTEHNESPPHEGASCETLSVVTKSSESPPALYDGTSEHSPPTTSELPAEVLKKSDIPTENCSSSVDGCQELPRSLSNPILSSTEIPTDADLHSSGSVSSDPQQEKITEALTESQGSSKCSSHIASSETAEIEGNSTLLSCSSTASDLCVAKEVQHSVVDSPSQSSPLALVPTETSSAEQESGNKMAMLVNQSLGKETEPDSQMCPQSTESKSLDKVSGEKDGAVTEGEENSAENEVPGNPENHDGEMIVEQLKSCNNAHLISETDTETLPQIVAIRSLSHEHATEEYTYRGKPTAPTSLEMEATKMKIVPILVSEPLKPVTIGSSLQPLEEVQEASVEVQEASVVEDTSFSTDIAIIDSSADEADSIGGLVINNVIGAADGVADFQPDEVETEKELTDISASAPQLEDSSDSGDERGPSAKRRKLENGPNSVEDKSNSAKKVILKVIPVKNGHGLWDSMKLQEVLLTNGTILLQIHASKESMELFEPDKNDQTIDFTAIMAEAKDDDHALALGRVEPECDDPLGFINTSQPPQTTTFRPSYGRPFAHSHIRSTALMPAMPRPTFKHLQTPQQYHMKNEVLGLPPPLEFEEPQIGPSSSDWSAGGRTWHLEHVGNIHKALATVAIQDCTPSVTKDVPSHPASSHSLSHLCVTRL